MSDVELGLEELEHAAAREQWAERLVELAAFSHVAFSKVCTGYTMVGGGRAVCGNCDWQLSGRMSDVGEERSAFFALFVLGVIGDRLAQAIEMQLCCEQGHRDDYGSTMLDGSCMLCGWCEGRFG